VAIFVLVLWLTTAGIGTALLRAGGQARVTAAATAPAADSQLAAVPARIGALPMTPDGKPPPVPHTRVAARPGEHPLLEFSHPALAIVGLAFWTMYTFVHYRPAAWIACGVLAATICMGLGWMVRSGRARLARAPGRRFPSGLAALHGAAATLTVLLAVLTAALASR
jgi:preprotein translocase subunit SecD